MNFWFLAACPQGLLSLVLSSKEAEGRADSSRPAGLLGKPDALPPCSLPLLRPRSWRIHLLNFSIFALQSSWSDLWGSQGIN